MILAELDRVTYNAVTTTLTEREQALWRDDGGRDGDPAMARTSGQRLADAFVELVQGPGSRSGSGSESGSVLPVQPRHQLNVLFDLAGLATNDGAPLASLVEDGRPLPAAVLDRIACNASVTPVVFDGAARPIWVGRDHRSATIAQWRGLIARDRGCVGCGAAPQRCEAHHITAWSNGGRTDVDNLVLVCTRCHHDVHDRGMQLVNTNGRWHITPRAGPDHDTQPAA